ncbi:MAG: GntR family transcriptional regulator [Candidatus Rokubacteria bacterium]|nr:GntR family transcriptional regulator [Candidatus Rokubacteria bacterium]
MRARVPRYQEIAEDLRARIQDGGLAPGTRLDTQRQLAVSFGVTLMTLRQALDVLEREKLIERRHGLGTFVAAPSIDYDILQLRRFAGDLSAKGEHVTTRLLGCGFVVGARRVTTALGLGHGARVLAVERLRLVDERPLSLQRSFLPARLGEDVARADLALTPLAQILEYKLGITVSRAREVVSAVRLGQREAGALDAAPGAAAFESERVSFDAAGAPVVFDRVFIPGDRFRITRELSYTDGPMGTDRPMGVGGESLTPPVPKETE